MSCVGGGGGGDPLEVALVDLLEVVTPWRLHTHWRSPQFSSPPPPARRFNSTALPPAALHAPPPATFELTTDQHHSTQHCLKCHKFLDLSTIFKLSKRCQHCEIVKNSEWRLSEVRMSSQQPPNLEQGKVHLGPQ